MAITKEKAPNKLTRETLEKSERGEELHSLSTDEQAFKRLVIEPLEDKIDELLAELST